LQSFKFVIKEIETIDSTNNALRKLDFNRIPNGYCILADFQDAGKGQRGKTWHSSAGQNLTFSFFLKNEGLAPNDQFKLLQAVSLALLKTVNKLTGLTAKIKWPNDIMIGPKKVAGVLIENFIQAGRINSIVGIGLNVNQKDFPSFSPAATSLYLSSGEFFNLKLVLSLFEHEFAKLYAKITTDFKQLEIDYRVNLYAQGHLHDFETQKGNFLVAEVIGVDLLGRLILNVDGHPKAFLNGEIRWLF